MSFTYFIADLHLSADRPDITECLMRFLKEDAINADALYVLGDLFEVWIGDDNVTPFNTAIASAFKAVSQHCPIYFIHGNRDFAIREKWLSKAGMTLLNEQEVVDLKMTNENNQLRMHQDIGRFKEEMAQTQASKSGNNI